MARLILFLLLIAGFAPQSWSQSVAEDYYSDRLFVKVNPSTGIVLPSFSGGHLPPGTPPTGLQALVPAYSIQSVRCPFRTRDPRLQCIYEFRFTETHRIASLIEELQSLSWVDYAERIPRYRMDFNPDDLSFIQWGLSTIDATQAWDISTGSADVVVAIVDNAVRYTHEDLAANVWVNPGEIAGNNVDDDGNGFVDDMNGYDVADDDNDPMPPAAGGFDHGSHVGGIAGAVTDNGTGIASIGFNVSLMCIKTKFDTTTGAELDNTYGGVDYAIASGADVVNMSFGGMGFSSTFASLFVVGHDSGIVFVASAGNDGQFVQRFPAAYNHVISVGSTDLGDGKSSFSNYHPSVDVMAPGNGIWSCMGDADDGYGFMGGTSMSAPLVAGLCGLILSTDPTLTPDEVEACLEAGCENIDAQNTAYVGNMGAGRINARNSLQCAQGPAAVYTTTSFSVNAGFHAANEELWLNAAVNPGQPLSLRVLAADGRVMHTLFEGVPAQSQIQLTTSCTGWAAGLYLIECCQAGQRTVKRLLMTRN